MRGRGAVRTVTRSRQGEHALLATPRRDIATVAALAVVTAAFFVAMAMADSRARIGRLDAHFLHLMVSIRTPWLTTIAQGFNFIGLAVVTLPTRLLIAGASAPEQVRANVAAAEWSLSRDDLAGVETALSEV